MLKSYNTVLKANTPTIICEPELDYELAVNSISIFGGANGGYVTISIGDFSMEHSIAANARIVFPFFMGVSQFMSLIAESNNDDILVSVAAEQFACDKEDLGPEPEKDGSYMPLTIRNMQNKEGYLSFSNGTTNYSKYFIEYKTSNNPNYWSNYNISNTNPGFERKVPSQGYIQIKQSGNFVSYEKSYLYLLSDFICEVFGDIVSLVNYYKDRRTVFANLFKNSKIKKASKLILDNVNLEDYSFFQMFLGNQMLTEAPAFPNKTLAPYCCCGMYKNCISLVKAPEIPKRSLVEGCFKELFCGCSNLNYIKVNFTNWGPTFDECTKDWVKGVAPTGTFYKPKALPEEYGEDRIPKGWTVVNID